MSWNQNIDDLLALTGAAGHHEGECFFIAASLLRSETEVSCVTSHTNPLLLFQANFSFDSFFLVELLVSSLLILCLSFTLVILIMSKTL